MPSPETETTSTVTYFKDFRGDAREGISLMREALVRREDTWSQLQEDATRLGRIIASGTCEYREDCKAIGTMDAISIGAQCEGPDGSEPTTMCRSIVGQVVSEMYRRADRLTTDVYPQIDAVASAQDQLATAIQERDTALVDTFFGN